MNEFKVREDKKYTAFRQKIALRPGMAAMSALV